MRQPVTAIVTANGMAAIRQSGSIPSAGSI
jgi:hypothetical protein